MQYKARLALYCITGFESRSIKVDYSSKALGSNVRGVGNFFDTRADLGQLSPYNFKKSYINFPKLQSKIYVILISYGTF
jgi:hypothetical protein